jgi:hypothetical protein
MEDKTRIKKGSGRSFNIRKEGAGQICLIGTPNSGKSTLLKKLTGVDVTIRDSPFTTTKPEKGMMNYKGANVQIVELPAIIEGSSQGKAEGNLVFGVLRNADAFVCVLDSARALQELDLLEKEINEEGISWNKERAAYLNKTSEFSINYLNDLKEKIENKGYKVFLEEEKDLNEKLFRLLNKVLVYTKKPGQKLSEEEKKEPLIIDKDDDIEKIAKKVHKDLVKNFKFARVYGSGKFFGQRVSRDYKPKEGDIIEIYF